LILEKHVGKLYSVSDRSRIPNEKGLYIFYSEDFEVLYVGISRNLRTRIMNHFTSNSNTRTCSFLFRYVKCFNDIRLIAYEEEIIQELKPVFNECFNHKDKYILQRRNILLSK
jgi:excinuclease UvrABC nuclease subunit